MVVEARDVRTALNEIDEDAISNGVITQKIGQAKVIVTDRGVKESDDQYEYAVIQTAAFLAFMASPPMEQKRALDAEAHWNVKDYIENLKWQMNLALESAGGASGGRSAAFVDNTDGVYDDVTSDTDDTQFSR